MKKLIYIIAAALAAVACASDNGGILRPLWSDLGVITYVEGNDYFEITDDKGNVYVVEQNVVSDYGVAEGKRLYFGYYEYNDVTGAEFLRPELQGEERVLAIQLERLEYVLSKPMIRESFIRLDEEVRRDSIGYDGIRPYETQTAWFGGNYLNIRFEYLRYSESRARHMINLVWDDVRTPENEEDDYVHLHLHHNAFGEVPTPEKTPVSDTGICSFDLSGIVPDGAAGVKVKLFWDWYELPSAFTTEYSEDMGEFVPGSGLGTDTDPDDQHYYVSPPENPTAFVL